MKNKFKQLFLLIIFTFLTIFTYLRSGKNVNMLNTESQIPSLPSKLNSWEGFDISDELLTEEELSYNFIKDIHALSYYNENIDLGLTLTILNSDHFHNPKVCITSHGYEFKEDYSNTIYINKQKFPAYIATTYKDNQSMIIIYWFTMNNKVIEWHRILTKQFIQSLIPGHSDSYLMQLEIPIDNYSFKETYKIAELFLNELYNSNELKIKEIIFGQL